MFATLISLLLPLVSTTSPATQVYTVNGSGPADFPGIAEAIASPLVTDGDTLLVSGGSYASFVLDKPLHILPVAGEGYGVDHLTVKNVPYFTLIGALVRGGLKVQDVQGASLIDRCRVSSLEITPDYAYSVGRTQIINCDELLIQRGYFVGGDACYTYGNSEADHAMEIVNSTVVLSNSNLSGGDEAGFDCPVHYPTVGLGLYVRGGSNVMVVDSSIVAGVGGTGGVPAVSVQQSDVVIRGNSNNSLQATAQGFAVVIDATSTATVSGVTLIPPGLPAGVATPLPAEPFLRATGGETPGAPLAVDLFGPTGTPALVAFSMTTAQIQLPAFSELLWLYPSGIFHVQPLVQAGQEIPAGFSVPTPTDPAVTGFKVMIQALVDPVGGSGPWLTNPFGVVLGG